MDRLKVFRTITADEIDNISEDKLKVILDDYYPEFVNFCNCVKDQGDLVKTMECVVTDDNISYKMELISGEIIEVRSDRGMEHRMSKPPQE